MLPLPSRTRLVAVALATVAAGLVAAASAPARVADRKPARDGDPADSSRAGAAAASSAGVDLASRLWPGTPLEELVFPALRAAPPRHGSWSRCPAPRSAPEAPAWLREVSTTPGCSEATRAALAADAGPAQDLLSAAAYCDDAAAVRRALQRGAAVDGEDSCGWTALVAAASVGAGPAMDALLEAGASASLDSGPGDWARSPLVAAIAHGRIDAAGRLLRAAADPRAATRGGRSALMLAAVAGNVDLVKQLLKAGARPCQRDALGLTAIAVARARELTEVVRALVPPTSRCDADLAWRYGRTRQSSWQGKERRWKRSRR